ncbi:hypothetical protein [Streptomyces sp. TLI_185]|uniref:hypothetical protein n=1 Tax=Streptomyces sp. TLI_185 TaxID=2485151 RepID=UPI000F5174DE|nr:hypothetical protein [Streptomyces sp. TLI_185]RPF39326.1 hypothetical protein EDD92_9570 [Streptomyces sp. TLI_185]
MLRSRPAAPEPGRERTAIADSDTTVKITIPAAAYVMSTTATGGTRYHHGVPVWPPFPLD